MGFVGLNAVQHRVDLPGLCLRFVIPIAQRAAVHANQFNYAETDENLSDHLENESEHEESHSTDATGDEAFDFQVVEELGIDHQPEEWKIKVFRLILRLAVVDCYSNGAPLTPTDVFKLKKKFRTRLRII